MDNIHKDTEIRLKKLEKRLRGIYNKSYSKLQAEANKHLSEYKNLSPNAPLEERQKLLRKILKSRRLSSVLAAELSDVGGIAESIIMEELFNVFELNYIGELYSIDKQIHFKSVWEVYDKNVLRRIFEDSSSSFTQVAFKNLRNKRKITRRLQNELAQSILTGESIPKIAKRIQKVTEKSLRECRTIARTETTRAQNQGRETSFEQAIATGIELKKQWVSTLDMLTRDSHRHLNMEIRENEKPFSNGLMYPGDSFGGAAEVINCRCTMVAVVQGYDPTRAETELNQRLKDESYRLWGLV